MKDSACILCSSKQRVELFAQAGNDPYLDLVSPHLHDVKRSWYICEGCGFVYRSPVLDDSELENLYKNYEKNVFRETHPDDYFDRIVSLSNEESENWQKVNWVKSSLESIKNWDRQKKPRILDVGCGGGTLLYSLIELFKAEKAYGVEPNSKYCELAKRRSGAEVMCQNHTPGMFGEKFDLITCAKVLEHVMDPQMLLNNIAKDLKYGGLAFIEVPDICDIWMLPPTHERFFIPHVIYFSIETLSELLARAGLGVVAQRTIVTERGRSYLQVLCEQDEEIEPSAPPYNIPSEVVKRMTNR